MSYTIVEALARKAALRADELQVSGNNHLGIARLLREEGFVPAADEVEKLGGAYQRLAGELRNVLKELGAPERGVGSSRHG